jgi:hypothetical protein
MRTVHVITAGTLAAAALAAAALLSGPYDFIGFAEPAATPTAQPAPGVARPAPLLGADGTPQPALPDAVPADPLARTSVALYATRDQALALGAELDGAVIWVDAACCDEQSVSSATEAVEGFRAERYLGLDAPVFITGRNLQWAALVVNRLTDEGYEQVFLVTR